MYTVQLITQANKADIRTAMVNAAKTRMERHVIWAFPGGKVKIPPLLRQLNVLPLPIGRWHIYRGIEYDVMHHFIQTNYTITTHRYIR